MDIGIGGKKKEGRFGEAFREKGGGFPGESGRFFGGKGKASGMPNSASCGGRPKKGSRKYDAWLKNGSRKPVK